MQLRDTTSYEYKVELLDDHDDIIDSDFYDEADQLVKSIPGYTGQKHDICLVRDVGNNEEGLKNRQHAYIYRQGVWDTPTQFDEGDDVPKYRQEQIKKIITSVSK